MLIVLFVVFGGIVIVMNGGSSSGKSSIARALQEVLSGIWLTFGLDTLIDALPGRGDSPRAGIASEQDGSITISSEFRAREVAWYAGLAAMARAGTPLILDEVFLSGADDQERVHAAFDGLELLWVGVHCAPDVAASRESQRRDRVEGLAHQQASSVHAGVAYDIEVDTTDRSAAECALQIAAQISS